MDIWKMIKIKKILNEIGEGTTTPFNYKLYKIEKLKDDVFKCIYKIYIDKNIIIDVYIVEDSFYVGYDLYKYITTKLKKDGITYKKMKDDGYYRVDFETSDETTKFLIKNRKRTHIYVRDIWDKKETIENFLTLPQLLRLMSTLIKIIIDFDEKYNKKTYHIYAAMAAKNEDEKKQGINRRFNLYKTYITKNAKDFKIIIDNEEEKIFFYKK